jgi:hypothetical protein
MNSRSAWVPILCFIAVCGWGQTKANTEGTAASKITALEQVWVRALTSGDLQALDDLADSGLSYVGPDGSVMTKAELLLYAKSTHPQRVIKAFTKVQVFDDTAVANGTYESKEYQNGKVLLRKGQFTDTWFRKDAGWVCIAAQQTPILGPSK